MAETTPASAWLNMAADHPFPQPNGNDDVHGDDARGDGAHDDGAHDDGGGDTPMMSWTIHLPSAEALLHTLQPA